MVVVGEASTNDNIVIYGVYCDIIVSCSETNITEHYMYMLHVCNNCHREEQYSVISPWPGDSRILT